MNCCVPEYFVDIVVDVAVIVEVEVENKKNLAPLLFNISFNISSFGIDEKSSELDNYKHYLLQKYISFLKAKLFSKYETDNYFR